MHNNIIIRFFCDNILLIINKFGRGFYHKLQGIFQQKYSICQIIFKKIFKFNFLKDLDVKKDC